MTRTLWSPQALLDLESIRDYIARDSPRYGELVIRRLVVSVERLDAFPQSGRIVPERNTEDIREIIVKPYRIVYRLRPELVAIVTVFRAWRMFPELRYRARPSNALHQTRGGCFVGRARIARAS